MIYLLMPKNFVLLKVFWCQIWIKKYGFRVIQEEKGELSLIFTITVRRFFYVAIDKICVEMDHRISEGSKLMFDVDKLARLANIYHTDFSDDDRGTIREQLVTYVYQVKRHASFTSCEDVQILAMKMVKTEKHLVFSLVYKLVDLTLIFLVSTTSVERDFSAMKIIKSNLSNKINDVWFTDLMICYIEQEIFKSLKDVDII